MRTGVRAANEVVVLEGKG